MVTKRMTLVALALLLTLGACTDAPNASPAPSPSPSPSLEPGIVLRGWPTDALDCGKPDQRWPKPDPVRFDTVTELLVCAPGKTIGTSIPSTDPNFDPVMRELSAEDESPISCPYMQPDGRETTLIVLAATPDQEYRVRLPAGTCGSPQQDLSQALTNAGVRLPGRTTTY